MCEFCNLSVAPKGHFAKGTRKLQEVDGRKSYLYFERWEGTEIMTVCEAEGHLSYFKTNNCFNCGREL